MTNKEIGKYGENLAKDFLIKKGFKILETNYRYSRQAEIDIIAKKKNKAHFIEVKTRTQRFYGTPLEAVNRTKLNSIYKCAVFYIQNSKEHFDSFQIDAIGIIIKNNTPSISFIENIAL